MSLIEGCLYYKTNDSFLAAYAYLYHNGFIDQKGYFKDPDYRYRITGAHAGCKDVVFKHKLLRIPQHDYNNLDINELRYTDTTGWLYWVDGDICNFYIRGKIFREAIQDLREMAYEHVPLIRAVKDNKELISAVAKGLYMASCPRPSKFHRKVYRPLLYKLALTGNKTYANHQH